MHAHSQKDNTGAGVSVDPVCHRSIPLSSPFFVDEDSKRTVFCDEHCREVYLSQRRDPVCGMRLLGPTPYTLQEQDGQLSFCSIDCRGLYIEQRKLNKAEPSA